MSAVVSMSAELHIDTVLERLVAAGCDLTHASYGALGVLGPHGGLRSFVHRGMDADTVSSIGSLPRGRGVLGHLVSQPRPLRLHDLSHHPSSVGFPPLHPRMQTFLGVPVRARGVIFGNLYLTDKEAGDDFTAHDEQVALALAAAAGIALDHAHAYGQVQEHEQWLETAAGCTLALTSAHSHADGVAKVVELLRDRTAATVVRLHEGPDRPPSVGPDQVPTMRRLTDGADLGVPGDTWALCVPLGRGDRRIGTLVLCWPAGDQQTAPMCDLSGVAGFGDQLALALVVAEAQANRARLAVLEERERIARDLHDMVIQRLFAIGLHVQAAAQDAPPDVARGLESVVDALDTTIKDVRATIFRMGAGTADGADALRSRIDAEVVAARRALGFVPRLRTDGVTVGLPRDLDEDVVAVIREGLSNVARHARAREAGVRVEVGDELAVEVSDDGIGIPAEASRRSGLANLAERARRRGGAMTVAPRPEGGSLVRWSVPLH